MMADENPYQPSRSARHLYPKWSGVINILLGIVLGIRAVRLGFLLLTNPDALLSNIEIESEPHSPNLIIAPMRADAAFYISEILGSLLWVALSGCSLWSGVGIIKNRKWSLLATSIAAGAWVTQSGLYLALVVVAFGFGEISGNNILGLALFMAIFVWWVRLALLSLSTKQSFQDDDPTRVEQSHPSLYKTVAFIASLGLILFANGALLFYLRP